MMTNDELGGRMREDLYPALEAAIANEPPWHRRLVRRWDVSTLLRLVGGAVTVAAILLFLFQRWDDASDLYRYGMILGQTLLLTLLGFAISHWMNEPKSARMLVGLSLVSSTAVFTLLGAMIHSQVQWMPAAVELPDFAIWAADSTDTVLLSVASVILLGGLSLLGFSVLARSVSRRLSLLYLFNIGLLLLPVRDMAVTTLLAVSAAFLGLRQLAALSRSHPALKTAEGLAAGVLVMSPLVVMIGRGAYLYAEGAVAVASLALLGYILSRQLSLALAAAPRWRKAFELMSLAPAVAAAMAAVVIADEVSHWSDAGLVLVFGGVLIAFLTDLAMRANEDRDSYLGAIAHTVLLVAAAEVIFWPAVGTAVLAVVLSAAVVVHGYAQGDRWSLRGAFLTLLGSFAILIREVIDHLHIGSWIGIAVIGMAVIVLAAVVERHGGRIKGGLQRSRP